MSLHPALLEQALFLVHPWIGLSMSENDMGCGELEPVLGTWMRRWSLSSLAHQFTTRHTCTYLYSSHAMPVHQVRRKDRYPGWHNRRFHTWPGGHNGRTRRMDSPEAGRSPTQHVAVFLRAKPDWDTHRVGWEMESGNTTLSYTAGSVQDISTRMDLSHRHDDELLEDTSLPVQTSPASFVSTFI
ncbi:uncharacterized protein LOC120523824 isoform X2 [Polypterus senegalus]|uniref:uncharacterized protein LOC120523824 isoform X2 n=1 Tax=Polypterus senegalus TaxID=55291 RepID=UPI001963948B|nr:uncharacterized protein LOC120523824 isoform X2 [Polypterus senegalus]XP_039601399.1 uncharacterized protein LOC120523824 isoform X2 [Polypterus senegalus]XP_039601400.1 uncharacterized protein LOC120523824 isoform X2 [Polypterus senegalus]